MAFEFLMILAAVLVISLFSFVGVLVLVLKRSVLNSILFGVVAFAAGTLLGAAFMDLMPEALELGEMIGVGETSIRLWILSGLLVFFSVERFISWHHHHHREAKEEVHKEVHAFTYLSLFGDSVHNFLDGAIIAASFLVDVPLGIATTVAIALHEIPQEIGDFALLIYGGFSGAKALFYNFVSALMAVVGGIAGYVFLTQLEYLKVYLLAFAAGGFVYVATADLIPELHKESGIFRSILQFALMIAGIALIFLIISLFE